MSELPHLRRLNPPQRQAVVTLQGPLLVLAGAGSGKTRVLTRRIAHLLHEGVAAENILAVTFTNKAASEMKERVVEIVGEAGRKVWISTFHSSCVRILRQDIEAMGYTPRFTIYDDDDQRRLIKEILKTLGYEDERSETKALLGRIDHYKNRMLDVDDLLREHRTHLNDKLIRVWREYEAALQAADALDFNDLIGMTVRLFREHPTVLGKWQDRFQYLLVDEYQDTNHSQYTLLRMLSAKSENLAVVGDDDQSIYGFRGADISNILNFQKDFPDATVVRLEQNYRSTGHILTVANSVVRKNSDRIEKSLWTAGGDGRKVRLVQLPSPTEEATWITRAIQQLQRDGRSFEDIAIVYRTNATSRIFETALSRARIPHRIVGGLKFYQRREIRDILGYLRIVTNPADDAAFLRVVNVPSRGIGAKTLATLREMAVDRGEPLLKVARGGISGRSGKAVQGFVALIDELAEISRTSEPAELTLQIIKRSGYHTMLESEKGRESESRLENLNELLRDAVTFAYPEDARGPHDRLRAWLDRIALTGQDEEIPEGGEVTLMTVHNAKGLEYPVVFVVHMMEGQFPHARSAEDPSGVQEERRLTYVAFTRAQQHLIVTWNVEGTGIDYLARSSRRQSGGTATPSRFLFNLPEEAVHGDLPMDEPATSTPRPYSGLEDANVRKLAAFVRRRREEELADEEAPVPDGVHRLTEIEHISQLHRGRRIHHRRFGVGTVQRLRGEGPALSLWVDFDNGRPRNVSPRAGELHLIDD